MRGVNPYLVIACFVTQFVGLGLYGIRFWVSVFGTTTKISWLFHEISELAALIALFLGTVFTAVLLVQLLRRQQKLEYQVDAASKRFQDVIMAQFKDWDFTEAEVEIGMLLIKGLSIAEIAHLRGRSQATVKAQNSAIYQKSGMANRAQLVSYFVEELTSGM
ncbi:MAG: helix-turn-helix transcriptional regulator [Planktomarina sp.]